MVFIFLHFFVGKHCFALLVLGLYFSVSFFVNNVSCPIFLSVVCIQKCFVLVFWFVYEIIYVLFSGFMQVGLQLSVW